MLNKEILENISKKESLLSDFLAVSSVTLLIRKTIVKRLLGGPC